MYKNQNTKDFEKGFNNAYHGTGTPATNARQISGEMEGERLRKIHDRQIQNGVTEAPDFIVALGKYTAPMGVVVGPLLLYWFWYSESPLEYVIAAVLGGLVGAILPQVLFHALIFAGALALIVGVFYLVS